jgi:hydrogenase maturation protease
MQDAQRIVMVDAAVDDSPVGTVRRLKPRFSTDYPRTLTAHDIGLKDLLDAFYLLNCVPDVTLFAVTINPHQDMTMELSTEVSKVVPEIGKMILSEVQ